jgi:hypothetical protein
MKIIDNDDKEWEVVGIDSPVTGDYFVSRHYKVFLCTTSSSEERLIVKPILFRAEEGELYYTVIVHSKGVEVFQRREAADEMDENNFERGNYFKTEGDAQPLLRDLESALAANLKRSK